MIEFFAMNVPFTPDDRGYLLWLQNAWPGFLVPFLCLLSALVAAWFVARSRRASTPNPGSQPG